MRWLGEQPPGIVVISDLNHWYRKTDLAFGLDSQALTTSPAGRAQVLDDGLTSTIVTLKHAGHSVLVVQAVPDFEYPVTFDPLRCTWSQLRADTCISRMPRSVADSIQQVSNVLPYGRSPLRRGQACSIRVTSSARVTSAPLKGMGLTCTAMSSTFPQMPVACSRHGSPMRLIGSPRSTS